MTPDRTCATCRHGVPVDGSAGSIAATHRHCALGHPELRGQAVRAWLLSATGPCRHRPSRWEAG